MDSGELTLFITPILFACCIALGGTVFFGVACSRRSETELPDEPPSKMDGAMLAFGLATISAWAVPIMVLTGLASSPVGRSNPSGSVLVLVAEIVSDCSFALSIIFALRRRQRSRKIMLISQICIILVGLACFLFTWWGLRVHPLRLLS